MKLFPDKISVLNKGEWSYDADPVLEKLCRTQSSLALSRSSRDSAVNSDLRFKRCYFVYDGINNFCGIRAEHTRATSTANERFVTAGYEARRPSGVTSRATRSSRFRISRLDDLGNAPGMSEKTPARRGASRLDVRLIQECA
ncbi:hypothetical protein EVAR_5840_1 [Eumeta japonica]|uniref:Uncharacterized protein n=1 Tax=Eumeta variegata TaxID=151549 RepID=A0A4C1TBT8_EUMVA|nr:hypothetical protein EVAR_5840_1 [Eumeta japonica]